ncbi:MAG: hypothetical protein QXW79_01225 [Thermoplasmata archaeon]
MNILKFDVLVAIVVGILLIIIIYCLSRSSRQLIPNSGTITIPNHMTSNIDPNNSSGKVVDELVDQYLSKNKSGDVDATDPMSEKYYRYDDYSHKKNYLTSEVNSAFTDDGEGDPRNFTYKKKKFTRRTPEDIKDLFDVNKMLPQEIDKDWFDIEPLQTTKKIKDTHLLHPKVHMGINTVGSSLKNGTHDLRGDIVNPKIPVSPWGNSTIEPDTNIRGICSSI